MFERLPGFRDFYPEECLRRNFIFRHWTETARLHDFEEYDIPTLEPLDLFTEKSGAEIISQLFHFEDQGGRKVALRPELTPSLARMIGSKVNALKRPIKWFNIAENFRYERQQKGRLRSHYQFNGDIFGEESVAADAEVMALALNSLQRLGLNENTIVLRLSDRDLWMLFLKGMGFEGDRALDLLSVVDKMERMPGEALIGKLKPFFGEAADEGLAAIQSLASIRDSGELRSFLKSQAPNAELSAAFDERLDSLENLLGLLKDFDLDAYVRLDLGIVRGLAYYTGYVFEVFEIDDQGKTTGRALAGGGRYDHLLGKLGFGDLPAVGFGMGDVTLLDTLDALKLLPPLVDAPDIYIVHGGDNERSLCLRLSSILRQSRLRVRYSLKSTGFGKQFKMAGQSGARFAIIIGSEEYESRILKVRDLKTGGEKSCGIKELLPFIEHVWSDGIEEI